MKRTYSSILILLTSIIVFLFAYIMRTACKQIPVYGTSSTGLSAQHFDRNGAFAAADRQKEGSLMESDTENMPEKREQSETDDEHKQNKLPIVQSMQETSYYCVPACIQMALRYHAIESTQQHLAQQLHTDPVTGTEYVDMARVLNSYLFPGTSIPSADEPGYHVQTLSPDDHTQDASDTFSRRCVQNIDDGYPVFAAVDLNALYPALAHANHMVIVIGYEKNKDQITSYYIIDPYPPVQDEVHRGLKQFTAQELVRAILVNEEPAYIW